MRKSLIIPFLLMAVATKAQTTYPGLQLGYCYNRSHMIDAGINVYHSWEDLNDHNHTLGPSATVNLLFTNGVSYISHRYGFNYHFTPTNTLIIGYRITAAFEDNRNRDHRIGADLGVSCLGVFIYGGYYYPIGRFENPGIGRLRIGIRLILNPAPVEEIWE